MALLSTTAVKPLNAADSPVRFGVDTSYFSQKVDDFRTKKANYQEERGGQVVKDIEEDIRNVKTETDGVLFEPKITLWDRIGVYGILGVMNLNHEGNVYDSGDYLGKVGIDGENGFAWGFGADAKIIKNNGWELTVGGQILNQKADGNPYTIDPAGNKQTFEEIDFADGATSSNPDYNTKFREWSIDAILSKEIKFNKNILNSITPYIGAEFFNQRLKTDGTTTLTDDFVDSYSGKTEFERQGWNATTGLKLSLWKDNASIGIYGKWPNKQEIGGRVTFKF